MILAIIFTILLFAPLCAFIAGQRGYSMMSWYVVGLFTGPLGLLAGLLPKRRHEPEALFGQDGNPA